MQTLTVGLGDRAYPIYIGQGLLASVAQTLGPKRRVVVTDSQVADHYLAPVLQALGLSADDAFVFASGEPAKSWDTASALLDFMLAKGLGRDAQIIALGGGVVGDLTGFCAAIYQRGVPFVQIPTTLLAMVDSSVGGKTAVNHPRGKNLIGAFHQPQQVLADLDCLRTLPARELSAGIAEVIKYGMLGDAAFFGRLESGLLAQVMALDPTATAEVVAHCCQMKASIVALDEREEVKGGPRALLNLGHTFGHAVEAYTGYTEWLHGEAVGLGLMIAADLSHRLGWMDGASLGRVKALLAAANLPLSPPPGMTPADFLRLMQGDKKTLAGQLRLVLLRPLGQAVLTQDFDPAALDATLAAFCRSCA